MKILVTTVMLILSFNVLGMLNRNLGEWGSGGGNALVCFEKLITINDGIITDIITEIKKNNNTIHDKYLPYIKSIEMFDLYEAKKRRGLNSKYPKIIKIKENEKIYEYIDRLSQRFNNRVSMMNFVVQAGKELIPDTQIIFHEFAVKYQNDLGNITLPGANCIISTMAAQVNEDNYYVVHIDQRLYDHPKHLKQSKATLILHELIYATARRYFNHTGSGATRNLIRYYISYHDSFTEGTVAKAIHDLGFKSLEVVMSKIVEDYKFSQIMGITSTEFERSHNLISELIEFHYRDSKNKLLRQQIYKKIEMEELGLRADYVDNFAGERRLIDIALENSKYQNDWRAINVEFNEILAAVSTLVNLEVKKQQQILLYEIKMYTDITLKDLDNLTKHLEDLFSGYESFNNGDIKSFYKVFLIPRNEKKYLYNEIYTNILKYTICNSNGTTVIIPKSFSSNKVDCFGPVILNNVIPNIGAI